MGFLPSGKSGAMILHFKAIQHISSSSGTTLAVKVRSSSRRDFKRANAAQSGCSPAQYPIFNVSNYSRTPFARLRWSPKRILLRWLFKTHISSDFNPRKFLKDCECTCAGSKSPHTNTSSSGSLTRNLAVSWKLLRVETWVNKRWYGRNLGFKSSAQKKRWRCGNFSFK